MGQQDSFSIKIRYLLRNAIKNGVKIILVLNKAAKSPD